MRKLDLSYFEDGEDDDDTFEDYHEWEREALLLAKDVAISDDYLELPERESFEDYNMMEEFCPSIDSSEIKENLLKIGAKAKVLLTNINYHHI